METNLDLSLFKSCSFFRLIASSFWASSNSEILACVGIHGQGIYMNMANKTLAVKFSSHPDPDDGPLFIETFTALDALTRSI